LENAASKQSPAAEERKELLLRVIAEIQDSTAVLQGGRLHPAAVSYLVEANRLAEKTLQGFCFKDRHVPAAIKMLQKARTELVL